MYYIKKISLKLLFLGLIVIMTNLSVSAGDFITYQGRLTDTSGIPVTDSSYTVEFALFADSVAGSALWLETATVTTDQGLFVHLLGSETSLPASLIVDNDQLFLQTSIDGIPAQSRTRLTTTPSAILSKYLKLTDDNGTVYIATSINNGGTLQLNDSAGDPAIALNGGYTGDSSVIVPDSAINAEEILDEPGVVVAKSSTLTELSTGTMTDLVTLEITIPDDGYIVLYGKCYLLLSGTVGANSARIQIDETEDGPDLFPYYTQAGLGGYVNISTNYFPVYVTRTYYKSAGTYTFRMEGRAVNPLPAVAKSWDHILTATYFPTSYGWVSGIAQDPTGHPEAVPYEVGDPSRIGTYYDIDLRTEERENKSIESDNNKQ